MNELIKQLSILVGLIIALFCFILENVYNFIKRKNFANNAQFVGTTPSKSSEYIN